MLDTLRRTNSERHSRPQNGTIVQKLSDWQSVRSKRSYANYIAFPRQWDANVQVLPPLALARRKLRTASGQKVITRTLDGCIWTDDRNGTFGSTIFTYWLFFESTNCALYIVRRNERKASLSVSFATEIIFHRLQWTTIIHMISNTYLSPQKKGTLVIADPFRPQSRQKTVILLHPPPS